MSDNAYQMFLSRLERDAGLRQELRAAGFDTEMPAEAVIAFAASKGFTFSAEDVGELTDQQLDAVAGGAGPPGDLVSGSETHLQQIMNRWAQTMGALSNLMQKASTTSESIIGKIK